MFSKTVILLSLLAVLPCLPGNPTAQRSQIDAKVRGNSFGLENFLFQQYDTPEVKDTIRVNKTKRVRPVNPRGTTNERGQTYGLENLRAQLYESNRLKPQVTTVAPQKDQIRRRPVELAAESNKIRENFVPKPESFVETATEAEAITQEAVTERIRKRITMRRRRKRPSNAAQLEANSEITGNAIVKPVRIPIYPQMPKVVIRTKLPDENIVKRLQPVGVKKQATAQTEKAVPEFTEQEEATTTVTEKTTAKIISTTTIQPSTINLKTFLKQQTETLSLSELLQTQNLSLADLLRGNKDASSILKARQSITSTTAATKRKQFSRLEPDQTVETPKKVDIVEVTTSRSSYNGFQPKIPRVKTTEQTNVKLEDNQEIPKQVKRPNYPSSATGFDPQNRLNELRLKLRNFQSKTNSPTAQPETTKPIKVEAVEPDESKTTELPPHKKNRVSFKSSNNPELSLILPNKVKTETENLKRPERLTNWNNRLPSLTRFKVEKPKQKEIPSLPLKVPIQTEDTPPTLKTEPPTTPENEPLEEEIRKPEPKDELIELLKSEPNANRLQKILDSRNMTIQELLDNREKPIQMNISTLFNHEKPTTPQPTLFDSLPDFGQQETDNTEQVYDDSEGEESAPVIAKVLPMPNREPKQYEFPVTEKEVSEFHLQPDDITERKTSADSALWKLSEKSIYYGSAYGYGHFPEIQTTEKPKPVRTTEVTDSDIYLLGTIRKSQEANRKFKLDLNEFIREEEEPQTEDIEKSYIPPAVKSAIIASGVVMGIALFVFIAIFAACGWKQRQIRLKGSSSTLGDTFNKRQKSKRTLSPVSFKDTHSYKKTIDFEDDTSESGTSHTSSYLWSTLKNTFTSRASTLKSRMEKEEKLREDKVTLRRNESRRKESRADDKPIPDEIYTVKKIDRDRNVINTSFNFKRSPSNNSHFNECVHGY